MAKAISERIELRDVGDVAPDIVAEAAAAALARLDALGVSPLQACLAQGRLEAMDDQGKLDAEEPAFADHGVDPTHVEAYGAAADAAAALPSPMRFWSKSAPPAKTCRSPRDHGSANRT